MEANLNGSSGIPLKCSNCEKTGHIEWICLKCNSQLHDICIAAHRTENPQVTHSIIPNFDALTRVPIRKKLDTQPAADLVKVTGSGVANGVLSTFDSRFTVNTNGAGFGELGVRIRGPTGAFAIDMSREPEDKKKINCKYDATETGQYVITVTWSDDEVPGSPFTVHLVKTQDELEKLNLPQKDEITKL